MKNKFLKIIKQKDISQILLVLFCFKETADSVLIYISLNFSDSGHILILIGIKE